MLIARLCLVLARVAALVRQECSANLYLYRFAVEVVVGGNARVVNGA